MGRNIDIAPDEFYHIYNRGTEKRKIFLTNKDYERFLGLLYACNGDEPVDLKLQGSTLYEFLASTKGKEVVDLCAYVLMPNHFHLLVRSRNERDVSKFMQRLGTGYTMYFNVRQERSGALFQGKYKARHVNTDKYLAYLISYIHLNPVKLIEPAWKEHQIADRKKAEEFLLRYRWSSYQDYIGIDRPEKMIVQRDILPEYWNTPKSFGAFVSDWLERDLSLPPSPKTTVFPPENAKTLV